MAILIQMVESGGNIVTTISGNANTDSLTASPSTSTGMIIPSPVQVALTDTLIDRYSIGTPSIISIGSGTSFVTITSGPTGDKVGFRVIGPAPYTAYLELPQGYVSKSSLSATATSGGATFASAGITPGTYTWTWGSGLDEDSLTIQVGPEPTTTTTTTAAPTTTTTTTEPFIVKSANTEYVECRICNDVAETQNTPHPVYTDGKGNEVIQLNAVVIGGNGLNS